MQMRANSMNLMKPISLIPQDDSSLKAFALMIRYTLVLSATILIGPSDLRAQVLFEQTAPGSYRIEFTNKDNNPYNLENPGEFLSANALTRRDQQNIPLSSSDLPVTPAYLDSLRYAGATILTVSKWFNAATILVTHDSVLNRIAKLTFIKKTAQNILFSFKSEDTGHRQAIQAMNDPPVLDYGPSWWQTGLHNGQLLHSMGYRGQNMTIAVIDAGFYHVDLLPAFASLWESGRILGTRDFVDPGADVYTSHTHGMHVLSIMGGYLPGELIGTAPEANYWLLRSEDTNSEYLIEEDNWIAAAEFADSAGADLINSSLGYSRFDDPQQDHTYADMNGNTTRVSKAADMAASKGILVVVSAGNQGNSAWKFISAPADADSVLAAGAVDYNRYVADFSSHGPSSDGNIKPDIMAIGKGTVFAGNEGGIAQGNGTSLSAPVITGLAACVWQANRSASAMEVLSTIRESADRYAQPDEEYGYGIPDFNLTHALLQVTEDDDDFTEQITSFPNPFNDQLYIIFQSPVDVSVDISLFDLTGKQIIRLLYPPFPGRNYLKLEGELSTLPQGVYILKVNAGTVNGISKLIKF